MNEEKLSEHDRMARRRTRLILAVLISGQAIIITLQVAKWMIDP